MKKFRDGLLVTVDLNLIRWIVHPVEDLAMDQKLALDYRKCRIQVNFAWDLLLQKLYIFGPHNAEMTHFKSALPHCFMAGIDKSEAYFACIET